MFEAKSGEMKCSVALSEMHVYKRNLEWRKIGGCVLTSSFAVEILGLRLSKEITECFLSEALSLNGGGTILA